MRDYFPFIIIGISTGSIYGLTGTGLVLTYKTSGIFNFAHGSLGTIAVFAFAYLRTDLHVPWPLAAAVSVLVTGHPRRKQVLAPVLDPLERHREPHRRERDAHVLSHRRDLLTEPTAGVPGDGPDPVLRDAEQPGAEGAMFVWRLGRDPHRHLVGAALVLDDDAAGLDRHRGVGLLVDRHFDDVGRRPEDLVEHRRGRAVVVDDVAPERIVHQHIGVGRSEVVDHRR